MRALVATDNTGQYPRLKDAGEIIETAHQIIGFATAFRRRWAEETYSEYLVGF